MAKVAQLLTKELPDLGIVVDNQIFAADGTSSQSDVAGEKGISVSQLSGSPLWGKSSAIRGLNNPAERIRPC